MTCTSYDSLQTPASYYSTLGFSSIWHSNSRSLAHMTCKAVSVQSTSSSRSTLSPMLCLFSVIASLPLQTGHSTGGSWLWLRFSRQLYSFLWTMSSMFTETRSRRSNSGRATLTNRASSMCQLRLTNTQAQKKVTSYASSPLQQIQTKSSGHTQQLRVWILEGPTAVAFKIQGWRHKIVQWHKMRLRILK